MVILLHEGVSTHTHKQGLKNQSKLLPIIYMIHKGEET
jgi:hypothetical protein